MLYTKPIEQITWTDVDAFCRQRVAENAYLDYKQDFPANLEKTIAAMANTSGGLILIGVAEDGETRPALPVKGIPFQPGLSERVTNIILGNVTPPVFPDVAVCRKTPKGRAVVVIRVPESHQTPHAIMRNTSAYIRTGNRNTPEELARFDQIEWLRERRRRSEELREQLLMRADERCVAMYAQERPRPAAPGQELRQVPEDWLTLSMCPAYPKAPFIEPPALNEVLGRVKVRDYYQTGGYTFPLPDQSHGRIVADGLVLHQAFPDIVYHTELNCFGLYVYKQTMRHGEYQWTGEKVIRASEIFCRLDEFLDSAAKYYGQLGYQGSVQFLMRLEGLSGCGLGRYTPDESSPPPTYSPDSEVRLEETLPSVQALEGTRDAVILRGAQQVAWAFGWDLEEGLLRLYYQRYKK